MEKPGELDASSIDLRAIAPEQWEAVKSEIARRAREERAGAMRELFQSLRRRWRARAQRRDPAVSTYEPLRS